MTTEFDRECEELGRAEDACLYGDAESETSADSTETPKHLAPGTYELTKRVEVDDDGTCHWVDMPDGPGVEYIAGFWHKTRSTVRRVPSGGTDNTPPGITDEMRTAAIAAAKADPEIGVMARRGAGVFHALPSIVDVALRAALAGRTVIDLPEPDARTVRALVEYWSANPATLPQEERFALQKLSDTREARRLAAESSKGGDPE